MRRADRLYQITLLLSHGKVVTAKTLAEKLEVSERTIYRDMRDLLLSGTPVDGEAGTGYILRSDYKLPALTFTSDELEALALGAEMVQAWGDREIAKNAELALGRIHQVIPKSSRHVLSDDRLIAPSISRPFNAADQLLIIRKAIHNKQRIEIGYKSLDDAASIRTLRPLGLVFWGNVWTLVAWCQLRNGFRNFRVDRVSKIVLGDSFSDERGKRWIDFLAQPRNQKDDSYVGK